MFRHLALVIILSICAQGLMAQNALSGFGQNRVQYKDFEWEYYTSEHFTTYFYPGGNELSRFVVTEAERDVKTLQHRLEFELSEHITIIIYNTLEELYQSNIGLKAGLSDNVFSNTGGVARIDANRIFVYFDGDHRHLEEQVREGIARMMVQQMLFSNAFQQAVEGNLALSLPQWFAPGLAAYLTTGWQPSDEDVMRRLMSVKDNQFTAAASKEPLAVGKSFWYFMEQKYGASSVSSLLYLTRINRSVENGIAFVTTKSFSTVSDEWYAFYKAQYAPNDKTHAASTTDKIYIPRNHRHALIYGAAISIDGKITYVKNDIGHCTVWIYDKDKKKTSIRFRTGFRSLAFKPDVQSPLVSWNSTGEKLAISEEHRGKQYIWIYDFSAKHKVKKERRLISNFQKITSMAFSPYDPNALAMTAINKGQSDVYTYNISTGAVQQITNDIWDDADAHFVRLKNRGGIVFSSNRVADSLKGRVSDTTMPMGNYDVFFYNTKTKSKYLLRMTNTPLTDELQPMQINSNYIGYLTDASGIVNRRAAWIDSVIDHYNTYYYFPDSTVINPTYNSDSLWNAQKIKPDSVTKIPAWRDVARTAPVSDYTTSIVEQSSAPKTGLLLQHTRTESGDVFEWMKIPKDTLALLSVPPHPSVRARNRQLQEQTILDSLSKHMAKKTSRIAGDSFIAHIYTPAYQSSLFNPAVTRRLDSVRFYNKGTTVASKIEPAYRASKVLPYFPLFYTDAIGVQLDNSQLFGIYQSFAGSGGQYQNPSIAGMLTAGTTDLLEDYRLEAGFRIPTTFKGLDFYTAFMNYKKRLDKKLVYYRSSNDYQYSFPVAINPYGTPTDIRLKTNVVQYQLSYPFNYTSRLVAVAGFRQDKYDFLSTDPFSTDLIPYKEDWGMLHFEYVYDNTISKGINILEGTRMKVFIEHQQLLDSIKLGFTNIGVDIRHYIKIDRNMILALRASGATSFGGAKMLYYLGGTDNWLNPSFSTATAVSSTENFAFQTLATPLRGFDQNVRNGNSYALLNAEWRLPVFSYFSNKPIRSQFVKNFMVLAFVDAGSAWDGVSPYASTNPYNSAVIGQKYVYTNVEYYRDPLVMGFGGGVRSTILGYYIRLDLGWGLDNGVVSSSPVTYFSLGTDF